MSEIKPALTPEEWEHRVVWFRGPLTNADPYSRQDPEGFSVGEYGTYGVDVRDGETMWVWDDSWALTVADNTRHALAALCLHGQPYGFTWEDVDALRNEWRSEWEGVSRPNAGDALLSIADRIEALLPPRIS